MIEIEKKFALTSEETTRLLNGASYLGERIITDVYYDSPDFSLTTKDWWLRARDGRFELKVSLEESYERTADQFDELESEEAIRAALELPPIGTFEEDISARGYAPFATIVTRRRKYKKQNFGIDVDEVMFDGMPYLICEIELMIQDRSETPAAIDRIISFAQRHDLPTGPVRGKVVEHIRRMTPDHFRALVKAGVVREFIPQS